MRIAKLTVERAGGQNVFEVQVYLDDLNPDAVQVELYADPLDGDRPVVEKMEHVRPLVGTVGGHVYRAALAASRPAADNTAARPIVPALRRRVRAAGSVSDPVATLNREALTAVCQAWNKQCLGPPLTDTACSKQWHTKHRRSTIVPGSTRSTLLSSGSGHD